jgi:hypothetical protein
MDSKKNLGVNESAVASSAAAEGARKLSLSVTRMKKLRSSIKAGGLTDSDDHSISVGTTKPWGQNGEAPGVL